MSDLNYFSYGLLTPGLAYAMSVLGSLLGLLMTVRARAVTGRGRSQWLVFAAIAIGGTGIWVMHFIAMLGVSVPGGVVRYDVPLTIGSVVVAIVVVGIGLFIVGFGDNRVPSLLLGGALTGFGVVSMHYMGMAAMHISGDMTYDPVLVAASVVIAVVAATVALWFSIRVRAGWAVMGASLIMGVAVTGMHYTGMLALKVHGSATHSVTGAEPFDFLLPLIIGISVTSVILLATLMVSPNEAELRREAELLAAIEARRQGRDYLGVAPEAQAPDWFTSPPPRRG